MKITFLGTNGWYDSPTGNTICVLLQTERLGIFLDAGNGFAKLDAYGAEEKPAYIFLSHFHLDHIIGLHVLNKFNFGAGLHVCGQEGTRGVLHTVINLPFSMPMERLGYPAGVLELPADGDLLPFGVEVLSLRHASPTIGFRITIEDRVVAYCPDTGYCENAVRLGRDADLLIAECAYRPGESSEDWPHLSPETAGRVALEAAAKRLALVHFDASRYTTMEQRERAQESAAAIFPNVFAAQDGQQITI